jgi:hypothetical protein
MFGKDTFQLLLKETNIHRLDVNKKIEFIKMEELRKVVGITMYVSVVTSGFTGRRPWGLLQSQR